MAQPFLWTPEIEDEIFKRIANGEAIRQICSTDRDEWLPSWETFRKRLANDPDFAAQYAHAREAQADNEFDEIRSIADAATPEDVAVARLRIDARKWRAGKLRPKVYGDKLDLTHANPDGSAITFQTVFEPKPE